MGAHARVTVTPEAMLASMIASGLTLRAITAWTKSPVPAVLQDDPKLAHVREHQEGIARLLPPAVRYRRCVVRALRAHENMNRFVASRLAGEHQRLVSDLGEVLAAAIREDTLLSWVEKHGLCSAMRDAT